MPVPLCRLQDHDTALIQAVLAPCSREMSDLHAAAIKGDLLSVQVLLDDNFDVNSKHRSGETALHSASSEGQTYIIEELLEAGVDIDTQNWNGQTALHLSALKGHSQVVELLLLAGADWTIKTQYSGMTALHLATYNGHLEIVQIMLTHQQDNIKDNIGKTALFYSPSIEIKREFEKTELHAAGEDSIAKGYDIEVLGNAESSSLNISPRSRQSKTHIEIQGHTNTTQESLGLSKSVSSNKVGDLRYKDMATSAEKDIAHHLKPSLRNIVTSYTGKFRRNKTKESKTSTGYLIHSIYGSSKKKENYVKPERSVITVPKQNKLKNSVGITDMKFQMKNSTTPQLPSISKSHSPYKKLTYNKTERKLPSASIDKSDYSNKHKERLNKYTVFDRLYSK